MIELWNRLRDFWNRERLARELREELRFHHQQLARDRRADGLDVAEAEYAARRQLGNTTSIREEARDMWSFAWFDDLLQDLRYGLRSLRHSPAFTAVAVLTLGLGIGANTAIFTVVNGVLFRPLPYGDPGRLVMLWETTKDLPQILISYPNFLDWKTRTHAFEDVALYNGFDQFTITGMGDAERVRGGEATGNLFDVLGVKPERGRAFRADDDRVGADRVVIVSDAFWLRHYGLDSTVSGKTITLDGFSYTVVGVLPRRVRLAGVELWVPIGLFANTERFASRSNHPGTIGLGRLKPGVTLDQMRSDLDGVYAQLRADYPRENAGMGASGDWMLDSVLGGIRPALYVLAGAVGLVLLIACANVANLVLGRASSRGREIALRVAIGARRGRIVRQLLTESVLLSVVGGLLGVALAWAGVRVLLALRPDNVPRLVDIELDGTVLAFALAVSVFTGLAFGLVPALHSAGGDLLSSLKEGSRGATAGRLRLRMRGALMVVEVALALVLLVGAGLLMRSFGNLTNVELGVDPRGVVVALVSLPERKYPDADRRRAIFAELVERARAIPQVTDAALATDLPVNSSWQSSVTFEGLPAAVPGREPLLNGVIASPGWFSTMRMRMMAGRTFAATDVSGAPGVLVISQAVAKRFYGGAGAVGRRIKMGSAAGHAPWLTIVGVVNDVKDGGLDEESRGTMYLPAAQDPVATYWLAVRSAAPAARVVPALREALRAIDKDVPLAYVQTLEERIGGSVAQPRFSMLMLGIFASIALLLAAIGIYGVIAYSVAQRTHEIGLRIALGARRLDVVGLVVRQVLAITGIGIVIGAAGALAAGSLLTKLLFGVQPSDPLTFVGVSLVLAVVALVAAAVPAWRAARLDPVAALRAE
jgi:putative ABC transport system permease protein